MAKKNETAWWSGAFAALLIAADAKGLSREDALPDSAAARNERPGRGEGDVQAMLAANQTVRKALTEAELNDTSTSAITSSSR